LSKNVQVDLITDPRVYTISEFLQREKYEYRIPLYQRDYQWTNDEVDDFEDDLFHLVGNTSEHFFGTLVLTSNSPENQNNQDKKINYVIDGQQRLTTSLLMLAVIKHLYRELAIFDSVSVDAITEAAHLEPLLFLGDSRNPAAQKPRLSANRSNQKFLTSVLTSTTTSGADVRKSFDSLSTEDKVSSEVIFRSYERLRGQVLNRILNHLKLEPNAKPEQFFEELISDDTAQSALQFIVEYASAIRTQALIIAIHIRSWTDSFGVFEGLNNRGMELSEKDIVKNTILSKAHSGGANRTPEEFKNLELKWVSIEQRFVETKFSNFLRHYLLLHRPNVSLKGILRTFRDHFQDSTAEEMLDELEIAAKAYETLVKPSTEKKKEIKSQLEILKVYETERAYPIALAARLSNLSVKDELSIFKAIEVLYVRRTIIMHLDNKAIEANLSAIARDLFIGKKAAVGDVLKSISKITPEDELFLNDFKTRQLAKASVARMVMTQIENHLRGSQHQIEFSTTTLEHICPQKPNLWNLNQSARDRHPLFVNRIGNLSLLHGKANVALSNNPFRNKKKFYKDENLKISEQVIKHDSWTEVEIVKRQEWLSQHVIKIWPKS
jgi:uncharacterized protein with ParB-like and HNH nuclease domain